MSSAPPEPDPAPPAGAVLPALRASDADRERTAEALRRHAGEGRLDDGELEARLDGTYGARTAAELTRLTSDLPALPEDAATAVDPARAAMRGQVLQQAGGAIGVSVLCVLIWVITTGASGHFWPAWVMLGTGLAVVGSAWRGLGPGGDPEAELARRAARERERRGYHDAAIAERDATVRQHHGHAGRRRGLGH